MAETKQPDIPNKYDPYTIKAKLDESIEKVQKIKFPNKYPAAIGVEIRSPSKHSGGVHSDSARAANRSCRFTLIFPPRPMAVRQAPDYRDGVSVPPTPITPINPNLATT